MKTKYWLLLMADAILGGNGGTPSLPTPPANTPPSPTPPANDWRTSLPEDLRANPVFTAIPDVQTLAKSYVSAQSLIGAKRIALPGEKATPQELSDFYKAIGRPESVDKYSSGEVKPSEKLNIDNVSVAKARETMFNLGLTDAQQKGIMDFYFSGLNTTHETVMKNAEAIRTQSESALRGKWGTNYDTNVQIAQAAVAKFATPEAIAELNAGLGNNPGLVEMFHNLGRAMMEDKSPTGGLSQNSNPVVVANQRIAQLKGDSEFMKALGEHTHPGHKDAVALWAEVHRTATPNNSVVAG